MWSIYRRMASRCCVCSVHISSSCSFCLPRFRPDPSLVGQQAQAQRQAVAWRNKRC